MNMQVAVAQPVLGAEEVRCINDALTKGAISGFFGDYLPLFEREFAQYCGCQFGVSTTSGTTAIHLALAMLDIGAGDEVLVSTLTNMATFFPVLYQGAIPVPIDIEPDTLNLEPALLEAHITPRTKAIIVVHLFGHPVDMDPIMALARKYGLYVIEDAAEAHGATYKGRKVGGIGDVGCFSFYANKIITTGEGGMITTNNREWADKARNLKGLAFGESMKFMHQAIGYNYRMTNLQAALGHAQFSKIENFIAARRQVAHFYNRRFANVETLRLPVEKAYARNVYWMYHVVLQGKAADRRTEVMDQLRKRGIETREGFIPYNMQKIFVDRGWTKPDDCPRASAVAMRGFYIPSGVGLTDDELNYVADNLITVLKAF